MDPNRKNTDSNEDAEPVADETYTTITREGADFSNFDPLIEAFTNEDDDMDTKKGKK